LVLFLPLLRQQEEMRVLQMASKIQSPLVNEFDVHSPPVTSPAVSSFCEFRWMRGVIFHRPPCVNESKHVSVSVVIPALNEANNLPYVLSQIPRWIDEIFLVDGHSTDNTLTVAKELRPNIRIILQPGEGKGDALRAGFKAAQGDIVVMLDADGSMRGDEILSYVDALLAGYDMVKGSRFIQGGASSDLTLIRRLGNRGLVLLVRSLFGGSYSDLCYGYSAFWRDVLPVFFLEDEPDHLGFEIEALMGARALVSGLKVAEVPSLEARRIHGMSQLHALYDGWRVLKTIMREWVYRGYHKRKLEQRAHQKEIDASMS
jgi:glycosyltransferase involved in cell wall biosynthesis